jgi:hypothetical protein
MRRSELLKEITYAATTKNSVIDVDFLQKHGTVCTDVSESMLCNFAIFTI